MDARAVQTRRQARWGLKGKLILSMLLVGVVPLLVGLVMAFYLGYEEIREVSGANFGAIATETARKLDLVLSEEVARTNRITREPLIVAALEQRRDRDLSDDARNALLARTAEAWEAGDPEVVQALTKGEPAELLRRYRTGTSINPSQHIPVVARSAKRALYITDISGALVASINTDAPYANSNAAWWQGAFNRGVGKPYIENVSFDERFGVYTFTLSLPIMDSIQYEAVGVLHQVYDAKEFLAPSVTPIRFGRTGHVMVIDSDGRVVTCPILPTGTRLSDEQVISLVTPLEPGWVSAPSDGHEVQSTSLLGSTAGSIIGFAPLPGTSRITRDSTGRAWHTFAWQSSDELFAPVQHLLTWISVFGLVAVGLLVTFGYMAATRILTPIRRLQEVALLIGRGELKEPIAIKTGDEIEDLADEINRMNAQLEAAFAGLTDQVQRKTQEVEDLQRTTDQILDSVSTPIFMLDRDAQVQYINRAAKEAFSLSEQHDPAGTLFELLSLDEGTQGRLRHELHSLAGQLAEGGPPLSALRSAAPPVETRDPLDPRIVPAPASEHMELQIGASIYRYEWFQIGGRSGDGQRIGLILRDTTEESQKQDRIIQAEKLGSMGILSAGIGHELNNPLFGILGLGEAIQDETDPQTIKAYARDIVQHSKRMATTIRDFTGLLHADAKDRWTQVDLNDQLELALKLGPLSTGGEGLEIQRSLQPLPPITAMPDEIRQAFVNVITNAVQAMGQDGRLSVSSQTANGMVRILIQDTGPGIPKAYLTKVFDPFFTTKGQGQGSGLGLTVANRIVTKYGGRIHIDSEEGKGTTCLITFPLPEASRTGEDRR